MSERRRGRRKSRATPEAQAALQAQLRAAEADTKARRKATRDRATSSTLAKAKATKAERIAAEVLASERIVAVPVEANGHQVTIETPSGLHRTIPAQAARRLKIVGGGVPAAVFEPPPILRRESKRQSKWTLFIAAVQANLGQWGRTPFSMSQSTARQMASSIRNGKLAKHHIDAPQGYAWETVAAEQDGQWYVWVRLVATQDVKGGQA